MQIHKVLEAGPLAGRTTVGSWYNLMIMTIIQLPIYINRKHNNGNDNDNDNDDANANDNDNDNHNHNHNHNNNNNNNTNTNNKKIIVVIIIIIVTTTIIIMVTKDCPAERLIKALSLDLQRQVDRLAVTSV